MPDTTAHLALPFIMAAQAQKHVTHNEALRLLDGIVQLAVLDRDRAAPPASPAEGDRYILASGATGAWAGWDGSVAYWIDGTWMRILPAPGWLAWIEAEAQLVVWTGSTWLPVVDAMGFIAQAATVAVAREANGASTGMAVREETLTGLSGASVDSSIQIPNRAIVLGVSARTVTAVLGASSYDCGIAGEVSKFGGSLGVAVGSSNIGVIGPTAFYADTPVRLTANGGAFTGGSVRIAIHYVTCGAPA
ncbi:DUF2793 domain-containing protein [Paracoccus siganidrum]|uniref:DUF2793 domain-containing protein n=1 Tax=Paracoccus siganidrum TaxID=1276757 RepID=A0A419A1T1_9RHOB|nr:DUF2793 domain-containing protein [Paracoccus siganidrum]RJL06935.1 DUF2793 domain-containing protein [Paracoccus siganidrum]RMC27249.1 DUF2793 domain-containing protein [Paracoccus siganidrum]